MLKHSVFLYFLIAVVLVLVPDFSSGTSSADELTTTEAEDESATVTTKTEENGDIKLELEEEPLQEKKDQNHAATEKKNTENYVEAGKKPYVGPPKKKIEGGFFDREQDPKLDTFEKYKRIFTQHRAKQLEAIKSITTWGDEKSRYDLINMMLQQLFTTIEGAKKNLTEAGYQPGDPFPEDEGVRDDLSNILENTAMFGDMVLRLPDPVHDLFDRRKDWQLLINWGYGFSMESGAFEEGNELLLKLMAQEIGILPHDPNFVNPFKSANKKLKFEEPKPAKKKEKKKIKRGPKMTHTEL